MSTREQDTEGQDEMGRGMDDTAGGGDAAELFLHTPPDEDQLSTSIVRPQGLGRYKKALKTALPVRFGKTPENTVPLETNGLYNFTTFGWLTPYLWQMYRHGIDVVQRLQLTGDERSDVSAVRMERFWQEELQTKGEGQASYGKAILKSFKTRLIIGAVASLVHGFLTLAIPILVIQYFLIYLSLGDVRLKTGIGFAIALGLIPVVKTFVDGFFWMVNFQAAVRIKYGSLALLYKKVLRLKSLQDKSTGDIVNFITNDGQRIWDGIIMGPFIIGGPVIMIAGCVYLVVLLGPWALISCLVVIGFYPFAGVFAKLSQKFREESIKITDQRVGLMTELLTSIKLIKMSAWETSFAKKIAEIRASEKSFLEKSVFVLSISMGSSTLVPLFASCLAFIGHVATGNNLTPTIAFTFVSLLNTMQSSMMTIPFALKSISEMVVTIKRMQEILLMEEVTILTSEPADSSLALEFKNACFSWSRNRKKNVTNNRLEKTNGAEAKSKSKKKKKDIEEQKLSENTEEENPIFSGPSLINVNFKVKKGQLVGLCGNVGCGKSSLINAVLGRMTLTSGTVAFSGRIAYASQQAWIINDTVRENITFGQTYDAVRYKRVVEACGLLPDLEVLPQGDMTEVGERGSTLSGGQKQRVALARAAYSYCDLILLDDPLSAVDIHMANHIFRQCVTSFLKGRSVILVTHHMQYLRDCDLILVMKEGVIVEHGSHEELLDKPDEYANLLRLYNKETDQSSREHGEFVPAGASVKASNEFQTSVLQKTMSGDNMKNTDIADCKLIQDETITRETVSWHLLHQYILAMGGYCALSLVFFCFSLPVAGVATAGWYLTFWLRQGGGNTTLAVANLTMLSPRVVDHPDLDKYLLIYGAFLPALMLALVFKCLSLMKTSVKASSCLHDRGFTQVLRAKMSFFDATPVGRIVNRFSGDLDELDSRLPMNADIFLTQILQIFAALAMIAYVLPWFLIAVIPLGALFFILMFVFHKCVHDLKYLDNKTRSPIISHMGTSIQGLASIDAYQKSADFFKKHCDLLNSNAVAVLMFYAANRWLALRMDIVSGVIAFLTALLILLTYDHLNAAMAGLALSYTVQLAGFFQFTARLAVETEARFTSVQRILEYCDLTDLEPSTANSSKIQSNWLTDGAIKFSNVNLRYRSGVPFSLRGVTFQVEAGKKLGIVGHSGAGKTSLTAALFRLVELDSGQVTIDDVDIATLALDDLRSKLSIIPQDPSLFVGTLRYNLDPFQNFSDADIWKALEKCHISQMVRDLENQLDAKVSENGNNFSVGERQLICLARAFLRSSKILVLDEATAAIDSETDALVQQTLKEAFTNVTMLIIAHRLNTVIDCSHILVMEDGQVAEFDNPANLLANPRSKFKFMLDATDSSLNSMTSESLGQS